MIHKLKTDPKYFEAVRKGEKTFEVRKYDRYYYVGDYLALNEFDREKRVYSGRSLLVKVTYVLYDKDYCLEGHVILGFKPCMIADCWQGHAEIPTYGG